MRAGHRRASVSRGAGSGKEANSHEAAGSHSGAGFRSCAYCRGGGDAYYAGGVSRRVAAVVFHSAATGCVEASVTCDAVHA